MESRYGGSAGLPRAHRLRFLLDHDSGVVDRAKYGEWKRQEVAGDPACFGGVPGYGVSTISALDDTLFRKGRRRDGDVVGDDALVSFAAGSERKEASGDRPPQRELAMEEVLSRDNMLGWYQEASAEEAADFRRVFMDVLHHARDRIVNC